MLRSLPYFLCSLQRNLDADCDPTVPCTSHPQMYFLVAVSVLYSKKRIMNLADLFKTKNSPSTRSSWPRLMHTPICLAHYDPATKLPFPLSGKVFAQFFPFLRSQFQASFSWPENSGKENIPSPSLGPQTLNFSNLFTSFIAPTHLEIALVLWSVYMAQSLSPFSHTTLCISGGLQAYPHYYCVSS